VLQSLACNGHRQCMLLLLLLSWALLMLLLLRLWAC
jgi:hypothetical protein